MSTMPERSLTGKGNRKKLLPILKHKISVIISKLRKPLPTVDSTVRITVNRVLYNIRATYSFNQMKSNEILPKNYVANA